MRFQNFAGVQISVQGRATTDLMLNLPTIATPLETIPSITSDLHQNQKFRLIPCIFNNVFSYYFFFCLP